VSRWSTDLSKVVENARESSSEFRHLRQFFVKVGRVRSFP
jgi:hypothetical protein